MFRPPLQIDCVPVRSLGFLHAGYLDASGNLVEYGDGSSTMGSGSQTYGLTGGLAPHCALPAAPQSSLGAQSLCAVLVAIVVPQLPGRLQTDIRKAPAPCWLCSIAA